MNPSTISARFTSRLRSEQVAAKLGVWLGVSFTVAFVTGLSSHFMQHPPAWLLWPSRPVNLYRFTQGHPYPFGFLQAHHWTAYVVYGALLIHVADEWAKVRRNLWTRVESQERRRLLLTVAAAGVITVPDGYRLLVTGAVRTPASLGYADLLRLPQHTVRLPIACVEGWSVERERTGVRLRDLLLSAGASLDAFVVVKSLERAGGYRSSEVRPPHWSDPLTLLALRTALMLAGTLVLAALPTVLALGRRADNPSILPLSYGVNLVIVLAAIALLAVGDRLLPASRKD
ncbi:molybdopterin-dependent oxidoreductase [Nonomuraea sp. B10E15]|uniref:molybdopterin-dependent oxidoreductase n=1 Tax=Nonomuraea sp. B10E15 TaxID=3153560 RepID=UPI00325E0EEF